MATAAVIQEMTAKYRELEQQLIPVEAFFNMQLEDYLKDQVEQGKLENIVLFRSFTLLTVSSTHAIFIAYPETVYNRITQETVNVDITRVAVPLVAMARESVL